jgi:hypothetical protein
MMTPIISCCAQQFPGKGSDVNPYAQGCWNLACGDDGFGCAPTAAPLESNQDDDPLFFVATKLIIIFVTFQRNHHHHLEEEENCRYGGY